MIKKTEKGGIEGDRERSQRKERKTKSRKREGETWEIRKER